MPALLPFVLVVIMITPSLARDPYSAAAVAPFSTVICSISSGLILLNPSPPSELLNPRLPTDASEPLLLGFMLKLVLSIGTPLITMSGLFCPENDDCPRILILLVPAGPVPSPEICTPAILPCRAFMKLGCRFTLICSAPRVAVA